MLPLELAQRAERLGGRLVAAQIEPVDEGPVPEHVLRSSWERIRGESAQLRELWRARGFDVERDPLVRELVRRGKPPAGGGATGLTGAAFMHNLPAPGSYVMDQANFAQQTERNDMPLEQRSFTGLGGAPIDQRISNVGVLSWIRIVFKGTLTVGGTGAVTATYQWPWNVIKRLTLNLNGQTSLIAAEGST